MKETKTLSEDIGQDLKILEMEYMPFSEMIEYMQEREQLPYKSTFSLVPYLEAIEHKLPKACANTKGALTPVINGTSKYIEENSDQLDQIVQDEQFQTLISLIVPSMFFADDMSFIAPPFTKTALVQTPAFQELLDSEKWNIKIPTEKFVENKNTTLTNAATYILNEFYDQHIEWGNTNLITLRNKVSGIERHFQLDFKYDFVKVNKLKPFPELSQVEINHLIRNLDDEETILQYFPTDLFEFTGFATGNFHDVSEIEIESKLKEWLNGSTDDLTPTEFLNQLDVYIQSFLHRAEARCGTIMTEYEILHRNQITSLTGLAKENLLGEDLEGNGSQDIYDQLAIGQDVVLVEDLSTLEDLSKAEKALIKNGFKSIILSPIRDDEGKVISVLEIGSTIANDFNKTTVRQLSNVIDILKEGYSKYMDNLEARITAIIQQKYTSIHPSVQWKFENVAMSHLIEGVYGENNVNLDSIVFEEVYPLYAQSDIVGSSKLRNSAIRADLIENLELLSELITKWYKKKKLPLLDAQLMKVEKALSGLRKKFVSNDETSIVNLLTKEIHPHLEKLSKRHSEIYSKSWKKYSAHLDSNLGIIYHKRKDFESSVNTFKYNSREFP